MSQKIDKMIEESQAQLNKLNEELNQNVQIMQQIQQRNKELQNQGNEIVGRINTLTELKELGNAAFQQVDDPAAPPEKAVAAEEVRKAEDEAIVTKE